MNMGLLGAVQAHLLDHGELGLRALLGRPLRGLRPVRNV